MTPIPPWAGLTFERLVEAARQLRSRRDSARIFALAGFDSAIEDAVKAYLDLHPSARGGRTYRREDVAKWKRNFHSHLDFLEHEVQLRGASWGVAREHIIFAHSQRNEHYHGNVRSIPRLPDVELAGRAAFWVFSFLFEIDEVEVRVDAELSTSEGSGEHGPSPEGSAGEPPASPTPDPKPTSPSGSGGAMAAEPTTDYDRLGLTEDEIEAAALAWLEDVGWETADGAAIAPGGERPEREVYSEVVSGQRLRAALRRLNPSLPTEALEEAERQLRLLEGSTLEARNRGLHRLLVDGVSVEFRSASGELRGDQVRVFDFDSPGQNDFLAVRQFTVTEGRKTRRLDLVLFVNGLPLGLVELKNAARQSASAETAFRQLQTYKAELPTLFAYNELLLASDGLEARVGTLTAGREWFKPWRTIDGQELADVGLPELQVVIEGLCRPARLLRMIRGYIVFDDDGGGRLVKKMAGYHQFHAVEHAVGETLRASRLESDVGEGPGRYEAGRQPGGEKGDRRIGVVWHTQGSGKSLTMAFYAGRVIREPAMRNPTLVVLTDRNDLDDQLFTTFARCSDLLRQPPVQAKDRDHLRELLQVKAGGVVFTTLQKFLPDEVGQAHPELSARRNLVVIADEAHRSQYGFGLASKKRDDGSVYVSYGLAANLRKALPHASFIGFTGTPVELEDANTRAVFGDYISVYDIQQAVHDGATVPIFYESRLAQLALDESEKPTIDPEFEEVTEGEEAERKEKLKSKWAQLEAVVGAQHRLEELARDLVEHFETRSEALEGKAMVVCMSRRICVDLYDEIVKLRPKWHDDADGHGEIKIVMTGSAADPEKWQPHIRSKSAREALAQRFRDPDDGFRIVLVRDMWLTGFDAPSLHTLYLDKPMRGHNLMQAIARVNRVFKDKPGGLVVDYLGVAHELKEALHTYTRSGGTGETALDHDEAVAVMLEKYEICRGLLGAFRSDGGEGEMVPAFDWSGWESEDARARLSLLPAAQEHVLAQQAENGKERFVAAVRELSKAFALAVPHEKALEIRDDVGFFQAVQAALVKRAPSQHRPAAELDHAVRQIIARAVAPEGVLDIFAAAGLEKPDISILSDQFLSEVRGMKHRNLAVEVLQKLLQGEVSSRRKTNVAQARSFAEMLEATLHRYQNRAIEAAQVVEELIGLAKDLREADSRGKELGLSREELAFYDALATNASAVQILGDPVLALIARELTDKLRKNVSIDWAQRENVRARLRVMVKRILRNHKYPPDQQEKATVTVLQQAEALSEQWVRESG